MFRSLRRPTGALLMLVVLAGCNASGTSGGEVEGGDRIVVGGGDGGADADLSVRFGSAPEATTTLRHARFEFAAPDAVGYECALGGGGYETCASPLFVASVDEGDNRLEVRALDERGAAGDVETFEWYVDDVLLGGHEDLVAVNMTPGAVEERSWRGIFRINCDFSHSSYDDPIVFPGESDAAHLHRFYGNTEVDEHTTTESLYTRGESSCQGNRLNMSAYWVPALLAPLHDPTSGARALDAEGEPAWQVVPAVVGGDDEAHEVFYYSAGVDELTSIRPPPPGLRMIAGAHTSGPGEEQDTSIVRWHCQSWASDDADNPRFSAAIPACAEPDRVRMDIFFPSCWDGERLDSADHRSHMAYPLRTGGVTRCPDAHPVPLVRVSYHYAFGVRPHLTHPADRSSRGWRLASDPYTVGDEQPGGLSLHGDWFNGWHPSVLEAILENCIRQALDCHDGNLANGYRLSGTREGTRAEPGIVRGGLGY